MGFFGPLGPGGFRRRGRRRGLVVGGITGAAIASRKNGKQDQSEDTDSVENPTYEEQLEQLQNLKSRGLISEEDYEAKKKQILGI